MHKDGGELECEWKLNAGLRGTRAVVGRLVRGAQLTFEGYRKQQESLACAFFVCLLPSEEMTQGFHRSLASRAMGDVFEPRPEGRHSREILEILQTTFYLMKGEKSSHPRCNGSNIMHHKTFIFIYNHFLEERSHATPTLLFSWCVAKATCMSRRIDMFSQHVVNVSDCHCRSVHCQSHCPLSSCVNPLVAAMLYNTMQLRNVPLCWAA